MSRRRVALATLGFLHVGIGLRMLLHAPLPGDPEAAIFHTLLPVWLRIILWTTIGAAVAVTAARTRWERVGWVLAVLMPIERTASYAWSALMWVIPGWPPGSLDSVGGAAFWAAISMLIWLMAGWPERRGVGA